MTIVALEKVTLYGCATQRAEVLQLLQDLGQLHLLNLNGSGEQPPTSGVAVEARSALRFLTNCPTHRRPAKQTTDIDWAALVTRAIEIQELQQTLTEERDGIEAAIEQLTPWGEFQAPPEADLGGLRLWFYVVPRSEAAALKSLGEPHVVASEDPTTLYVVAVSSEPPAAPPGKLVQLDPRPLSELQALRDHLDDRLDELHWERVELTRWLPHLRRRLDEEDDRAARQWADRLALGDADVFAVQGWSPCTARARIEQLAKEAGLAVEFAPPADHDRPPTLLHNPERLAGAEGAVTFYITPAYGTWDPTGVMFVSFSAFFGMIMADAGYGLLMAAALALGWRSLAANPSVARARHLLLAIVVATIAFGVMVGSYFGVAPAPDSWLARLQVLDFANRGQMMGLSILIGVAHLTLANSIMAWNLRRSPRALGSAGWVLLLLGALLLAVQLLEVPYAGVASLAGKFLLAIGGVLILFFSSERPLLSTRLMDWVGRLGDGLMALTGVSKLFGDVLSYLRLFALGLASAQLAVTFNQLASDMSHSRGLGVLLAVIILIVGHGINLVLGLMGGVVHGLRLNCIEFFNWSLTEEGYPFRPYQKKASV